MTQILRTQARSNGTVQIWRIDKDGVGVCLTRRKRFSKSRQAELIEIELRIEKMNNDIRRCHR